MFNANHYVPIVRWKRGEQSALEKLTDSIKESMTPVIEIPPIEWDFDKEMPKKTLDEHLGDINKQIKNSWNNSGLVFIDASQVCPEDDEIMEDGQHPLEYIFNLLDSDGISAVPVLQYNNGPNYYAAMNSIVSKYESGFCLRLYDNEIEDIETVIEKIFNKFDLPPQEIDIIVDYKELDPKYTSRLSRLVIGSLLTFPQLESWRTLSFVGTTIPESLSLIKTGTDGSIPRSEWQLYKSIIQSKISRYPSFGDYIISNPEYTQINPRFMKMAANIRYTTENEYLIFRGYSVNSFKHGKWGQMRGLCERVVSHPIYCGRDYSYGDDYIFNCANGLERTGNAETWRKVGTNHHLTLVVNELANLHEPSTND
ncbi:T4 beta protein [Scopulibacillus darangshiensis]|uniref:T4 beta protein n=1 Tax=Scopulibacillus darangshiensis TaxID=442528 RepID=A0A4R2NSG2_9BACL|nr:beta family protein [Scopulibacillus darangshiensis]TCP24899.1 T4 beta protein [Scopulibacillus darangshiensis]